VPLVLLICLAATFLFSVGYWYFMPAWPSRDSYSPGILGVDQRDLVESKLALAKANQANWTDKLSATEIGDIELDEPLSKIIADAGPALFSDNCATCHRQNGEGGPNFPPLNDQSWLWGGTPAEIYKTLKVGINADAPETRVGKMPAFGTTNILDATAIKQVASYVQSLSSNQIGDGSRADETMAVNKGSELFKTNCAACHGSNGQGNTALGAPNLADSAWIYGGDHTSISQSIRTGRAGHMPAWSDRLSDIQLRLLAFYVSGLANETKPVEE